MDTRPQTLTIPSQTHLLFFVMALGKNVLKHVDLALQTRDYQRVADAFNDTSQPEPEPEPEPADDDSPFGEPIHTYSRAEALEDGFLVDANIGDFAEVTRQHFRTMPVYMTRAVFEAMSVTVRNKNGDYKGIWHDVLSMFGYYAQTQHDTDRILFRVKIGRKLYTMKGTIGPNDIDDPRPAITILLADED